MPTEPRPFEFPPPSPVGNPNPPASHSPLRDQHQTPRQHTDLPLSLRGNGGSTRRAADVAQASTLEQLMEKLDRALSTPSAPSLHDADQRAVERWAERAAAGLVSRREALKLVREVERVLAEERRTARQLAHAQERIEQRLELAKERAAGTHWKRRDSGRRAKQPTHVEVDRTAWRRAKAAAARQGVGLGEYVGRLVASAEIPDHDVVGESGPNTVLLFARLAIGKARWSRFVAECRRSDCTIARGVGLVVEEAVSSRGEASRVAPD